MESNACAAVSRFAWSLAAAGLPLGLGEQSRRRIPVGVTSDRGRLAK
jgi:hypothetical protein